ncbi:phospholipid phosphatase 1 isoform X2 [Nasonia vitripennis]|uniref:Phosphatidic acid phosphatase type 2/haloperoxidase domain-containing protein n=1 Tax=Nasonia vitripennis TaxID=7425 RepID=A0A7M7HE26_NASVI|nr:phospholipid phosphatase 1 isoform X2 [Nasonia vitripennis]
MRFNFLYGDAQTYLYEVSAARHPISPSTTGVSFEAEGGIRNPACQDEDATDSKPSTRQHSGLSARKIEEPCKIHEKSEEFKEAMTVCRTRVPWRFSFNFFVTLLVSVIMLFGELGLIPGQKVGFYCNDPKISFKFSGDSVPTVALMVTTILAPALVIWATEWTCYSSDSYKSLECGSSSRSRQFWQWYGYYTLGWWYMLFIVEVTKIVVSEPRPHFIDTCRPKEIANCTDEYRRLYTCTNTELSWLYVNDADKSFPSGHSALSMFTGTFLVWYLQNRMPNSLVLLLVKPWLQCLAILWGAGCSLSRITDNRHHWWDVAVGAVLGVGFAVFVARVMCKGFKAKHAGNSVLDGSAHPNGGVGFVNANKRHQSIKKLLSNSSSADAPDAGRELGDMPATWTA